MISTGVRINVRNCKDFDMKLIGKGVPVGEVEEVSWVAKPMEDADSGLIPVGVSVKIKKEGLSPKCKATPGDSLTLAIQGKATNSRFSRISENIQKLEYAPYETKDENGKTIKSSIPDEFEEQVLYSFKGYMLATDAE